jgi:hypothetical protein
MINTRENATEEQLKELGLASGYIMWYGRYTEVKILGMTLETIWKISPDIALRIVEHGILNPEEKLTSPVEEYLEFKKKVQVPVKI